MTVCSLREFLNNIPSEYDMFDVQMMDTIDKYGDNPVPDDKPIVSAILNEPDNKLVLLDEFHENMMEFIIRQNQNQ